MNDTEKYSSQWDKDCLIGAYSQTFQTRKQLAWIHEKKIANPCIII